MHLLFSGCFFTKHRFLCYTYIIFYLARKGMVLRLLCKQQTASGNTSV